MGHLDEHPVFHHRVSLELHIVGWSLTANAHWRKEVACAWMAQPNGIGDHASGCDCSLPLTPASSNNTNASLEVARIPADATAAFGSALRSPSTLSSADTSAHHFSGVRDGTILLHIVAPFATTWHMATPSEDLFFSSTPATH
eukprot:6462957-Amphidinium_carterae.4